MTLLLDAVALAARRRVVQGPLAPLARSLQADLDVVLAAGAPRLPDRKARLTRGGGRCPVHGDLLAFDPWRPHAHDCARCGRTYVGEDHDRWWIMNYQLWLAERATHAAALHALTAAPRDGAWAREALLACARAYARYPDRDNVLGPSRPFFSTYLESIWVLHLAHALALLEAADGREPAGDAVRDMLLAPAVARIAAFDEGRSNRQVYHNAAMAACGVLLGRDDLLVRAVHAPSGLLAHLRDALLPDGTWYEGENYHLFAHRGLWHVVTIAERAGVVLPAEARRRFEEGFATPFATALPDLTFPARRDAQYGISLRQWRMAESCELGLARGDDPRLAAALGALYGPGAPPGPTGRAESTGEAERNHPPVALDRGALGWKALLCARAEPVAAGPASRGHAHLPAQGFTVFRPDRGRGYVALDYGETGGGHGHPDRLNVWLVHGDARVLEDVGTGSYVEPELHWYRSTLAHNAPLVNGRSQPRRPGRLLAHAVGDGVALVAAGAPIGEGAVARRTLVCTDAYVVDELTWRAADGDVLALPFHVVADPCGAGQWVRDEWRGADGLEDGHAWVRDPQRLAGGEGRFRAQVAGRAFRLWATADVAHAWWRLRAPGPPGQPPRDFLVLRAAAACGTVRAVWAWSPDVRDVTFTTDGLEVAHTAAGVDRHRRDGDAWIVARGVALATTSRRLDAGPSSWEEPDRGASPAPPPRPAVEPLALRPRRDVPALGDLTAGDVRGDAPVALALDADGVVRADLGRAHYRRSEDPWEAAGRPRARVAIAASDDALVVEVRVVAPDAPFAAAPHGNPLDNEAADTNANGVQLYVGVPGAPAWRWAWLVAPAPDGSVRIAPAAGATASPPLRAQAVRTGDGWLLRAIVPRPAGPDAFSLDLLVNEIPAGRERRRGQLVLSGGAHEWTYLRGDRQPPDRAFPFRVGA